jgi:signal transduction histidine kinase
MRVDDDRVDPGESLTDSDTKNAVAGKAGQRTLRETALETERLHLFSLLNELPGFVYVRESDYRIRFANRMFRQRFGDPSSEPCYQLIHNRTEPCVPCGCAIALAQGQVYESQWVFEDGTTYHLYDYPFVDVDDLEKVLHLGIDITKRKQAESELERANRELLALSQAEHGQRLLAEGLAKAALALNSSLDRIEVLDHILEQTLRVVPCIATAVMLVENQQIQLAQLRGKAAWSDPEMARLESGVPLESMPTLEAVLQDRQPVLIADVRQAPWYRLLACLDWVCSLALLPMNQGATVVGLIVLFSDQVDYFTGEDIRRLESFVSHATVAIENARLYQSMSKSREQLQSLSRRLVEVQENERRVVARELHDEAGQALASLIIQLKLLQKSAGEPDRVQAGTTRLIEEVKAVMENLHRLAMNLRPASLDRLGLIAALDQHCHSLAEQHSIRIAFDVIGFESRVAPQVETDIYRIVQEALNNVVRHSHATRADVLLERRDNSLVVIVEDNGQGFEPEVNIEPNHLGLVGIQERAVANGGSLTIESTPRGGSTLIVEIPSAYPDSDSG